MHMASWSLALLSLFLLVTAGLGPYRMCGLEVNGVEGRWLEMQASEGQLQPPSVGGEGLAWQL